MNAVNMFWETEVILPLTGENSHKLEVSPGVGGITIGTKGHNYFKADVVVDDNKRINWDAFNGFFVPADWDKKDLYPYGTWPRWFYYYGNDLGFIEWSKKRRIEGFSFYPNKEIVINMKKSNIYSFEINNKHRTELYIGDKTQELIINGSLENYIFNGCQNVKRVLFHPKLEKGKTIYKIPFYEALKNIEEVHIHVSATSAPFDCSSLLQFENLKHIYLIGNINNLDSLSKLKKLEMLGIWDAPDLSSMPPISDLKNLNDFVAINIDKKVGLLLREELKELRKIRKFKFLAIQKLRDFTWFKENYDLPFKYWSNQNERKANNAYKKCLENVENANTIEEVKSAIIIFIKKINK